MLNFETGESRNILFEETSGGFLNGMRGEVALYILHHASWDWGHRTPSIQGLQAGVKSYQPLSDSQVGRSFKLGLLIV